MRFEELDKYNQDMIIASLDDEIKEAALREDIKDIDFPTREEYTAFFNEYDEDYVIDENGCAESTVESDLHNHYEIEFEGRKVILKVFPVEFD